MPIRHRSENPLAREDCILRAKHAKWRHKTRFDRLECAFERQVLGFLLDFPDFGFRILPGILRIS
jgi:hypothetical protein